MRLDYVARIKAAVAVGSAILFISPGLCLAQQGKDAPAPAGTKKVAPKKELVSGVILAVEKAPEADAKGQGKSPRPLMRITINPNAVWRDWARDQSQSQDDGSPKRDAAKGAKSVATVGQPADANSVMVIAITDATRVETRFRSPTDETNKGETTPDKVKSDQGAISKSPTKGKPVQFRADDLLPGLYVEAEFRSFETPKSDPATTVTVIRPITVSDPPKASGASPK